MASECKHCGNPIPPRSEEPHFCCRGCAHVYQLIHDSGFGEFYAQQDRTGKPLGERPFQTHDFNWIDAWLKENATQNGSVHSATFRIDGLTCMGCVWLVERLVGRSVGVRSASVSLLNSQLQVSWENSTVDFRDLFSELEHFSYVVSPLKTGPFDRLSRASWNTLLCCIFALNALLLATPELFNKSTPYDRLFFLVNLVFVFLSSGIGIAEITLRWKRAKADNRNSSIFLGVFLIVAVSILCLFVAKIWFLPTAIALLLALFQVSDFFQLKRS